MTRRIVGIGSVCVEAGRAELVAYAIGSCIALCLYDRTACVGAMAHILLPAGNYTGHADSATDLGTKYADHALDAALRRMRDLGAHARDIEAGIVGGAMMFPHGGVRALHIGDMNVASVTQELHQHGIPLLFSVTGGEKSRTVTFRIPGDGLARQIEIRCH